MLIHRIAEIQKLPTGVAIGRTDLTKGRRKGSRKEGGRKEGRYRAGQDHLLNVPRIYKLTP